MNYIYLGFFDINAEKSKSSYLLLLRPVNESKSVSGNKGSKSSSSMFVEVVFKWVSEDLEIKLSILISLLAYSSILNSLVWIGLLTDCGVISSPLS